jgi:hypothetical protein
MGNPRPGDYDTTYQSLSKVLSIKSDVFCFDLGLDDGMIFLFPFVVERFYIILDRNWEPHQEVLALDSDKSG